ncbi:MAG TPA: polyribonucleotide nucleotidyltransferase, partial [Planctomycetota bacterium]|nr:polyribonucleotide nucleotidyltransferase [Planctomycetota bacterium]
RVGTPGRREIGHGALAERALEMVLPRADRFPYTIRITSDILESNGSSSMATVCAGALALMDAGVPISQPVAGIAMGLVMEGSKYAILSDILGSEDHCGDMDFKVAGTPRGITALQMDIKCEGLTRQIMEEALAQAREGRVAILRKMLAVLRAPRAEISPHAPRLLTLTIPEDKIGAVIGPGGRTVRALQDEFSVKISIEDDGRVTVAGPDVAKVEAAYQRVKDMTAEVEVGSVYKGKVTSVKEFGAFVEILPGQEGMVHVSELAEGFVRSVTDVVRIGDEIEVKVIGIDDFGKIKLSRRALLTADDRGGERRDRGRDERGERGEREDRPERERDTGRGFRADREEARGRHGGRGVRGEARDEFAERRERGAERDRTADAAADDLDAPFEERGAEGGRDEFRPHRGRRGRGDRGNGGFRGRRSEGRRGGYR